MKVLDFPPFRGSYVREFELSHRNQVNSIIKITHTHNLHVKILDFARFRFVRERTHIADEITFLKEYFNESPLFLTSALKLCIIHYFTSNRMIVC